MFSLPIPTAAHVRSFNLRTEKHGDNDVTAMDLGMRVTGPSSLLDMLHPGLRGMLYLPPEDDQATIPGEAPPWTALRCDVAQPTTIKYELIGRNVVLVPGAVESELRGGDELALGSCNVNAFKLTARAGGSVDIDFRIQTNDIDAAAIGKAGAMLAQDVKLSVTHSEVPPEEEPQGEPPTPAAGPTAEDLFTGGDRDEEGDEAGPAEARPGPGGAPADAYVDGDWPFPKGGEKTPAAVTEERTQARARTARGREKTAKALAAGAVG